MAETLDIVTLQQKRTNAADAGDQDAVARYDQRIKALQDTPGQPAGPSSNQSFGRGLLDTGADVVRAIPSAVRTAHEGLVGMEGSLYDLIQSRAGKVAKFFGASPETLQAIEAAKDKRWGPNIQEVHDATSKGMQTLPGGKTADEITSYAPHTFPGKAAQTLTEFATTGRPIAAPMRSVVAPTIGTEAGGAAGKALGDEEMGRLFGGAIGAMGPTGSIKYTAPRQTGPSAGHIETLTKEGVDLTAGQATGNEALKFKETGPYASKPAAIADTQGRQFTKAALEKAGIKADEASPTVLDDGFDAMGNEYDNLISKSNGLAMDQTLANELLDTAIEFQQLKGPQGPKVVEDYFNRAVSAAKDNGGVIPPEVFKTIRSDLSRILRKSSDPETKLALREIQSSLFDSLGRSNTPELVETWKGLNSRYRNLKTIEKAMGGAGQDTANYMITPAKLRAAVEAADKSGYARGRGGDLEPMARAGGSLLTPLPQSGTGPRLLGSLQGGGAAAGIGQLLNGQIGTGMTTLGATAASALMPAARSKLLTWDPIRRTYIQNATGNLPPSLPGGSVVTAALQQRLDEKKGQR